jgi:hypothetical protein
VRWSVHATHTPLTLLQGSLNLQSDSEEEEDDIVEAYRMEERSDGDETEADKGPAPTNKFAQLRKPVRPAFTPTGETTGTSMRCFSRERWCTHRNTQRTTARTT